MMSEISSSSQGSAKPRRPRSSNTHTRVSRSTRTDGTGQRATSRRRTSPNRPSATSNGGSTRRNTRNNTSSRRKPSGKGRPRPGTTRSRNSSQTFRKIQKLKTTTNYSQDLNDNQKKVLREIPPLAAGDIRLVPVCGVEGIGTNMTFIEMNDQIIIIDAGFGFSTPDTPGIDYTIPNMAYLKANQHKIAALVITHGHLDHVGGIPYVIEDLGFPTIYTREFGAVFIQKKLEEFPHLRDKVKIEVIDEETQFTQLSEDFKVKFFGLTHSIPDSTGVVVYTPYGGIVSTGDVRVENDNGKVHQSEIDQYAFFKDENILLTTMDSTGIEKPGWSISENVVVDTIDTIIKDAPGRVFIGAFSSQVERLMEFMQSAKKYNKYMAFEGRSIKSNMAIAEFLKLTDFSHVVPVGEIDQYPPDKVVVLVTGAQGEEFAALNRIANKSHKSITFQRTDTIVLSASVVPGNHYAVAQLKNNLFRGSYNVITYNDNLVHASGHGTREELRWIHNQIPYKFFMPVHGEPYMLRIHANMAEKELGVPKENIVVPDNGSIVEIRNSGTELVKIDQKIPSRMTVVDGSYVGPLHKVLMDDRKALSKDGMFVIVVSLDVKSGKLKKSPDIISRGFIYLRENKTLLNKARTLAKRSVETYMKKKKHADFDEIKDILADKITKLLIQETLKEPLVIPVVLGV
jgi:ribonuclease J